MVLNGLNFKTKAMTELRIREDKNIYNLYMDPVVLPDKDIYKLSYGDKAYDVKNNKGYIYKGETAGWVDHTVGSSEFYGEFTMADTAGIFLVSNLTGDMEYSTDNYTWNDVSDGTIYDGSLKFYIRQKPGGAEVTEFIFGDDTQGSEFVSVDKLDVSMLTTFLHMFSHCSMLKTVCPLDTSEGTDFSVMFGYCPELTDVPTLDLSKGLKFQHMFRECTKIVNIPLLNTTLGTDFSQMFYKCSALECIGGIDTRQSAHSSFMFSSANSIEHPTSAERNSIKATPGIKWDNTNPC